MAYFVRRESKIPAVGVVETRSPLLIDRAWRLANRNGIELKKDDWNAVADRLRRIDVNGDGLVQEAELTALDNPLALQNSMGGNGTNSTSLNARWVRWPSRPAPASDSVWGSVDRMAMLLANRYNRAAEYESMRADPQWGPLVAKHDADKDQVLSQVEWRAVLETQDAPFAAHCRARLSEGGSVMVENGVTTMRAAKPSKMEETRSGNAGFQVRCFKDWMHMENSRVSIRIRLNSAQYDPLALAADTFKKSVDKAKGYMTRMEAMRYFPLNVLFESGDLDNDGKMYLEELETAIVRIRRQVGNAAEVVVQNRGHQLLRTLDKNGNGAVDAAEQRGIASTLAKLDRDHDGRVAVGDLPKCYDVSIRQRQPELGVFYSFSDVMTDVGQRELQPGPDWFRLIDRNQDGIVSRAEYPGAGRRFQELDANDDGMVTAAEANASAPRTR